MDKYDEAIEWLVANACDASEGHDTAIFDAWSDAAYHPAGCLFAFATPSGRAKETFDGNKCGCITMIRTKNTEWCNAWTVQLTNEIRADERLPTSVRKIEHLRGEELRAALQPFAFWQRRLDKEIRQPVAT